ncbi:hypothetical protein L914_20276 [Phytophthora nicotianae]|uniref:Uncharacterized protein n=1 Tax=Phytophthora nicotianae TaxID=4792 RepID=W2M7F9_PHYNI|nr:hypothetical protein L914_20276 [Phytophthora nicotianae]
MIREYTSNKPWRRPWVSLRQQRSSNSQYPYPRCVVCFLSS